MSDEGEAQKHEAISNTAKWLMGVSGMAAAASEIVAWTSGDETSWPVIALGSALDCDWRIADAAQRFGGAACFDAQHQFSDDARRCRRDIHRTVARSGDGDVFLRRGRDDRSLFARPRAQRHRRVDGNGARNRRRVGRARWRGPLARKAGGRKLQVGAARARASRRAHPARWRS